MTTPSRRFSATCHHCPRVLLTTARIGDGELARLRDHGRSVHPRENLPADAGVAETLRHYDVSAQE